MITLEQVQELARLRIEEFPITTLFLTLHSGRDKKKNEIRLKDLIKRQRAELENRGLRREQLRSVERDFDEMLRFIQHFDRKGSSAVAVFSSSEAGLWQVHPLAQAVRDRLVIDAHPHIRPLSNLLQQFKRCLVVRLGRDRAVIDVVHLGEIRQVAELKGNVPSEVKGGFGGSEERRIARHVEDRRHRFLKDVVDRTLTLLRSESDSRPAGLVVVSGPIELVAAFEGLAPHPLTSRIISRLGLGPEAADAEVLARVSEAVQKHEREHGTRLADKAIKEATASGLGVTGAAATLTAFAQGQVASLAVSRQLSRPGMACGACSALALEDKQCPVCGLGLVPVPDVVEELIQRALAQAVEVVEVENHPELDGAGGLAALLRYRMEPRGAAGASAAETRTIAVNA